MTNSIDLEVFEALPDPVLVVEGDRVARVNARMRAFLGEDESTLKGRGIDDLVVEDDRKRLMQLIAGDEPTSGGILRLGFAPQRPEEPVRALDVRITAARPGVFVVTGRDEQYAERPATIISRLSGLYLSNTGRAMVDLDALVSESRSIFLELGWIVIIFEIDGDVARLRHSIAHEESLGGFEAYTEAMQDIAVPVAGLGSVEAMVKSRVGNFHDHPPAFADGVSSWARFAGGDEAELNAMMHDKGLTRGAWAPCIVRDRVRYVIGAVGQDVMERDFPAIQLFAAQISATVQMGELSAEIGQQHRLAALGQMSALLAHEVRNPLAVLFQAYRQIRRRVGDAVDIDELMDIVEEEARRLNHLVDDLVHFAGPIRPRMQSVSVSQVVRWAIEALTENPEFPSDRIELHVDVPGELPEVEADPLLLRQAISHLLSNASAHVSRGGNVWIEGRAGEEGQVRLTVLNDGEPLRPDVAFRVFEPFFTTKAKGSGLGLAVVRRLVEDQQGKVTLDEAESGVSFSVWLPRSDATEE